MIICSASEVGYRLKIYKIEQGAKSKEIEEDMTKLKATFHPLGVVRLGRKAMFKTA